MKSNQDATCCLDNESERVKGKQGPSEALYDQREDKDGIGI